MDLIQIITENQLKFRFEAFKLKFKKPSGTSRGVLTEKLGWKLFAEANGVSGLGECSVIPGLSPDYTDTATYEARLTEFCRQPAEFLHQSNPEKTPSLLFGIESAVRDWFFGGKRVYFDDFSFAKPNAIPINGLIWMGNQEAMLEQVNAKLKQGFSCIKMKVGAINFEQELEVIRYIRQSYSASEIVIRVDANGAFSPGEALEKLQRLHDLDVHSIEQPIKAGNWSEMATLCKKTPLPIALDEELIGIYDSARKKELLESIQPQYIILKPSLHGGISGSTEWIQLAEALQIDWWMTSALESNIGLNVIAQFTTEFNPSIPQGLGTGGLYETNFESHWEIEDGKLVSRI